MGVEFFLGGILESDTSIYASIFPWNHFKMIFQARLMKFEQNTHFFHSFEELDIEIELSMWFQIVNIFNFVL